MTSTKRRSYAMQNWLNSAMCKPRRSQKLRCHKALAWYHKLESSQLDWVTNSLPEYLSLLLVDDISPLRPWGFPLCMGNYGWCWIWHQEHIQINPPGRVGCEPSKLHRTVFGGAVFQQRINRAGGTHYLIPNVHKQGVRWTCSKYPEFLRCGRE